MCKHKMLEGMLIQGVDIHAEEENAQPICILTIQFNLYSDMNLEHVAKQRQEKKILLGKEPKRGEQQER